MKRDLLILSVAWFGVLSQSLPGEAGIGVVTGVRGEATVRRDPAPQPRALKFKDELFWLDTLKTGADSRLRLFILEKSVITMKEHSQLQLREEAAGPTQPKKKSIINLLSGAARAVVEKDALKDADYEIRTGRAVAVIRGSDVIAAVGTAMNDRLRASALPPVADGCVAFITGPGSRSGVTDVRSGSFEMASLHLLTACNPFTYQPISEEQWNALSNFLPGSQNADHTPGADGGGGGGGPPGLSGTGGTFPGGGKTGGPPPSD